MKSDYGRSRDVRLLLALAVLVALSVPMALRAQEITGSITGTVTDPSGAVVPGAQVTATNVAQGTNWPTTTNAAGVYNFPRLPVGPYTVKAEAKGFQAAALQQFDLEMNQVARMDIKLTVGAMTQTVEVTTAPPLLQTDTMQVGMVTSSNLNVNLPLATRNFIQLTLLTPGVTTVDPSSFTNGQRTGGGGRPYVNGNREEGNDFLLDGIDNNQISDNLTSYQPSPDAIQEFNMITNNAPAQYGQFEGGVINVTLKSGSDHYHGDVFEFLRNDVLNANSWSNDWNGTPKPAERWNNFGATFGGPIIKDKLFFFVDYEGERLDFPPSIAAYSVMTAAERQGNFSAIPRQLYSPCASLTGPCTAPTNPTAARLAYPGNIITNTIDPVAAKLFASGDYPTPYNGSTALINNAFEASNSTSIDASISGDVFNDQGDAKIDYMVNDKNHLWGSYSQGFQSEPSSNSVLLLGQGFNNSPFHGGVIDWTRTLSPSLVMEAKIGVNRIYLHNGTAVSGLSNFADTLGIADGNVHGAGLPAIDFTNGFASEIGAADFEELFADTTLEPTIDFIWTHNKHTFHLGFEAMRHDINTYYSGNNGKYGLLDYSGQYTAGPNPANVSAAGSSNGLSEADFYLGLPNNIGLGIEGATWGQRSWVFAPYLQDDWRVTKQLTLNLGLRWEYNQPWYEAFNRQSNFGLYSGTEYLAGQGGCPYSDCRALYNEDYADWEPRFGFAYNPSFSKNTVVRGAYTISSFLEGTGTNLRLPLNPPFQTETGATYNLTVAPYTQYFPGTTTDQGFSTLTVPSNPYAGALIRLWDPNVRPNFVQQWNFSVEHQFAGDMLLSVGYVGQHSTDLMTPMPYLQERLPGFSGCPSTSTSPCKSIFMAGNPTLQSEISQISGTASNSNQSYEALQASLTKHLSRGMEFELSYAYQKTMTNDTGYYGEGGQASTSNYYWQNLYNEAAEWGPAYFSDRNLLTFSYVYQLPFGAGKKFGSSWRGPTDQVLGGWQLSGIATFHSGFPMDITATDASGTNSRGYRANCIGSMTYPMNVGPDTTWFGTSAFSQPSAGTFGSCANGTTIGPGLKDWDLGVEKDFHISESKYLQFRSEFINFTNSPVFEAPHTSVDSTEFGWVTSSEYQRNIQFALKFYF
jgi:hypothetical protein